MRGNPDPQMAMLTSLSTEDLIPADHPIRRIRTVVDAVLADLDVAMYVPWAAYRAPAALQAPPATLVFVARRR